MARIGFTGGHHTGALVVAKELQDQGHTIVWFGHRHSMTGDTTDSEEYRQVTAAGIEFIPLQVPRFFHLSPFVYGVRLLKAWLPFYRRWQKEKIDLLLGFGGYLMVLPALASFFDRVPFFIHEQTRIAGRANYWLSFLAKKVFVSWPTNYPYNPKKTVYTGLPLRPAFLDLIQEKRQFPPLIKKTTYPTLLVTAGKQGSHFINLLIRDNLDFILSHFNLIHQTGRTEKTGDYRFFSRLRERLVKEKKYSTEYLVYPYLDDEVMASAYAQADLIVSRSGAHTSYELALLAKPALVIPAKFVPRNEQVENARFLVEIGVGRLLDEDEIDGAKFKEELKRFLHQEKKRNIKKYPLILDAQKRIIEQLKPCLKA